MAVAVSLVEARWLSSGYTDTSSALAWSAGDLIVVYVCETDGQVGDWDYTPTDNGNLPDFAKKAKSHPDTVNCNTQIWTSRATSADSGKTITVTQNSTSAVHLRWGVIRVTGTDAATPVGNVLTGMTEDNTTPYSGNITIASTGNAALWLWADWDAGDAGTRTQVPSGASELDYYRDAAQGTVGCSYTTGLSSGTNALGIAYGSGGGNVVVAGIEIIPAAEAPVFVPPVAASVCQPRRRP